MVWQYTPYTPVVFLAAVVGLGVALFALQRTETPGARPLAVLMVGASLWSFAEGMNLSHADLAGKVFWTRVEFALSGVVPIAWLALVLEYTGNDEWVTKRTMGILALGPLAMIVVLLTDPSLIRPDVGVVTVDSYRLVTESFGPVFYLYVIFAYLLVLIGAALLVRVIAFAEGLYRAQATALLAAIAIPLFGNVFYLFEWLPAGLDPTNVGFLFTGFIVAATIFRRQLLEVVPVAREVARDELLENMDDEVIVLDDDDHVADLNPAAAALLDRPENATIGSPVAEVFPSIAGVLPAAPDERAQTQLTLDTGEGVRYFDVRVTPLHRVRGMVAGRIVSLRDVTERRQRRQRLDVLNRLLRHNLRNEMNVIRGNAELLYDDVSDPALRRRIERIEETSRLISGRSDKVGRVAQSLDDTDRRAVDLGATIRDEVRRIEEDHPELETTVDLPPDLWVDAAPSVAIAVGELLSNAVEHNDDEPSVDVTATVEDEFVVVAVSDDGPGIDDHELEVLDEGKETALQHGSGIGLWAVNWIVEQLGGRLAFENDERGCTVRMWLPRATSSGERDPRRVSAD